MNVTLAYTPPAPTSCHSICGIWVPPLHPLPWKSGVLTTELPGKPLPVILTLLKQPVKLRSEFNCFTSVARQLLYLMLPLSHFSHVRSVWPHRRQPASLCPWDSPGKNTGVGCHFLLHFSLFSPHLLHPFTKEMTNFVLSSDCVWVWVVGWKHNSSPLFLRTRKIWS